MSWARGLVLRSDLRGAVMAVFLLGICTFVSVIFLMKIFIDELRKQTHAQRYQLAIDTFGAHHQKIKAIEEMAELSVELAKDANGIRTNGLEQEIADVVIVLEQLKLIYPGWVSALPYKREVLSERIESVRGHA